jgi:ABC-type glycerol-3-phosphate transport system substrate-binding protein
MEPWQAAIDTGSRLEDGAFGKKAIHFSEGGSAGWSVDVPCEGLYQLNVVYYYDDTDTDDLKNANCSLKINGEVPFFEAGQLEFKKYWQTSELKSDANGNDLAPEQERWNWEIDTDVADTTSVEGEYSFYLKAGTNRVEMTMDIAGVCLELLAFHNETVSGYGDYRQSNPDGAGDNSYSQVIQAEDYRCVNDTSLIPQTDRSGPDTVPNDPVKLKLNIISGNNFKMEGQKITWDFQVPSDGYYTFGTRYRQNSLKGLFVNRKILIDGKVPFTEFHYARFDYTEKWKYKEFDQPVYLKAGGHAISFEIADGELGTTFQQLEDCINILNTLYRKIIIITGTDPDYNRDYSLDTEIPQLLPLYQECSDELKHIYHTIKTLTGESGGQFSLLQQVAAQLDSFVVKPDGIAYRLDSYKSNISAISSLMLTLAQQPLDMDYITVRGQNSAAIKTDTGFMRQIAYDFQAFIGSFCNDYISIGSDVSQTAEKNIKVWYSGGREQAEIIKRLIDSGFTPGSNVSVDLKLVQISIAQSVLAGQAPDVVLNVSRDQPVNLAARGVLCDLSAMPDFDSVSGWFGKDSCLPYQYNGGTYGIPITMDYYMMFYRLDVLRELEIDPPKTWDEFYKILPVIQKSNMQIGLPYNSAGSTTVNDSGLLSTLLLQRGGGYYTDDLKNTTLQSEAMMTAFKEWTELYTQYGCSFQYDFYSRFRTGEMPIGIQSYTYYNYLSSSAPEIDGLWKMTGLPGTLEPDGTVNNSETSNGTAAILLKDATDKAAAWDFIKWWSSPDVQGTFGNQLEMLMGKASRYNPASSKAVEKLPWSKEDIQVLEKQRASLVEVPEVVGGYYYARGINNAFKNTILEQKNYREELLEQSVIVDNELARKRNEFGLS